MERCRSGFQFSARGTADVQSDIDILLVRRDDLTESQEETWLAQLDALAVRVRAWTGNVAQLIDTSPNALSHMVTNDDPLVESWRNDAIHLTGVRLAPPFCGGHDDAPQLIPSRDLHAR